MNTLKDSADAYRYSFQSFIHDYNQNYEKTVIDDPVVSKPRVTHKRKYAYIANA